MEFKGLCSWTLVEERNELYDFYRNWLRFQIYINTLRQNDAYVRQLIKTSFVSVLACGLFTKPLIKPTLTYYVFDPCV